MVLKHNLRSLQVIHLALSIGVILFSAILIFLKYEEAVFSIEEQTTMSLLILLLVVSAVGMFLSQLIPEKFIWSRLSPAQSNRAKIGLYVTGKIIQWAILEGLCMIALIMFLLFANYIYLFVALFLWFILFLKKPSVFKMEQIIRSKRVELD